MFNKFYATVYILSRYFIAFELKWDGSKNNVKKNTQFLCTHFAIVTASTVFSSVTSTAVSASTSCLFTFRYLKCMRLYLSTYTLTIAWTFEREID